MPSENYYYCQYVPGDQIKDGTWKSKEETVEGKNVVKRYGERKSDGEFVLATVLYDKSDWDAEDAEANCSGTWEG